MTKTNATNNEETLLVLESLSSEGIVNNNKIADMFESVEELGYDIDLHNTYNDGSDLHNYYLIKRVTIGGRFFTMVEAGPTGKECDPRYCGYETIIAFEAEDDAPLYIFRDDDDGCDMPQVGFVY